MSKRAYNPRLYYSTITAGFQPVFLFLYEIFEKKDSKVIERKITIKSSVDSYDCNIEYLFNENIAETVDFSVTE